MKVGFIGIGNMGFGMASNVLKKGFETAAFDLKQETLDRFAAIGGKTVKTNAELGDCDVVYVMTMTGAQAESALFDANGLCSTLKKGAVVIITASCGGKYMKEIAAKMPEGIAVLDCPVTGGQTGANNGTLTFMISGAKDVIESIRPVLEACASNIYYCGPNPGDGQNAKSCNQLMTGITYIASAEAMVLAAKAGLDPEVVANVIGNGIAGSQMFRQVANYEMDRAFTAGGAGMHTMYKDMGLVMDLARDTECPLQFGALTTEYFRTGWVKYQKECTWALAKITEELAGTEVVRGMNKAE